MDAIKIKEIEHLHAMMEKVSQEVEEGDLIRSSLRDRMGECSKLFIMVNNCVGLLQQRSNSVEELRAHIQWMNVEPQAIIDPIEKQNTFEKIQVADEKLDAMYEASQATKKELRDFQPTMQVVYVQMHQLDSFAETKSKTFLSTNLTELDIATSQELVVGASILLRKWQDRMDHYGKFL